MCLGVNPAISQPFIAILDRVPESLVVDARGLLGPCHNAADTSPALLKQVLPSCAASRSDLLMEHSSRCCLVHLFADSLRQRRITVCRGAVQRIDQQARILGAGAVGFGGGALPPGPGPGAPCPTCNATYCLPASLNVIGGAMPPGMPTLSSNSFSPLSAE